MSSLDTCMSRLDIHVSKVILESGKTETAKNSRLCVVLRMLRMSRLDIRMSKLTTGVGHTYVQPRSRGWTYVCPR